MVDVLSKPGESVIGFNLRGLISPWRRLLLSSSNLLDESILSRTGLRMAANYCPVSYVAKHLHHLFPSASCASLTATHLSPSALTCWTQLAEASVDALMLDVGQVLPFTQSQTPVRTMLPEAAAWVCPIALRLVRFARSQGWTSLAALIMPVASAGEHEL